MAATAAALVVGGAMAGALGMKTWTDRGSNSRSNGDNDNEKKEVEVAQEQEQEEEEGGAPDAAAAAAAAAAVADVLVAQRLAAVRRAALLESFGVCEAGAAAEGRNSSMSLAEARAARAAVLLSGTCYKTAEAIAADVAHYFDHRVDGTDAGADVGTLVSVGDEDDSAVVQRRAEEQAKRKLHCFTRRTGGARYVLAFQERLGADPAPPPDMFLAANRRAAAADAARAAKRAERREQRTAEEEKEKETTGEQEEDGDSAAGSSSAAAADAAVVPAPSGVLNRLLGGAARLTRTGASAGAADDEDDAAANDEGVEDEEQQQQEERGRPHRSPDDGRDPDDVAAHQAIADEFLSRRERDRGVLADYDVTDPGSLLGGVHRRCDCVFITVRGSTTPGDWVANVQSRGLGLGAAGAGLGQVGKTRFGVPVHRAYLARARSILADLEGARAVLQGRPVVLCGHSMGGAVAALLAVLLVEEWQWRQPLFVFAYGSPPFASSEATRRLASSLDGELLRFIAPGDIVPSLGPPGFDLSVGRNVALAAAPRKFAAFRADTLIGGAQVDLGGKLAGAQLALGHGAEPHSMVGYRDRVCDTADALDAALRATARQQQQEQEQRAHPPRARL